MPSCCGLVIKYKSVKGAVIYGISENLSAMEHLVFIIVDVSRFSQSMEEYEYGVKFTI